MAENQQTGKRPLTATEKDAIHDAYFGRTKTSKQIAQEFRIARQWVPQVARRVRANREKTPAPSTSARPYDPLEGADLVCQKDSSTSLTKTEEGI